ncbi:hypothetical protein AAHC03_0170 [Spirometra sp. Aus1]
MITFAYYLSTLFFKNNEAEVVRARSKLAVLRTFWSVLSPHCHPADQECESALIDRLARQTDEVANLVEQRADVYASLTSTYGTMKCEFLRLCAELEDLQRDCSSPIAFGLSIDEAVDCIRTNNAKLARVGAIRAEVCRLRSQWPASLPASESLPQTTTENIEETLVLTQLADRVLLLAHSLDAGVSAVEQSSRRGVHDEQPDVSRGLVIVRADQLREGCSARRSWFTLNLRLCRLLQTPFWQKGDWQSGGLGGLCYPSLSPLRPIVSGLRSGSRLAIKLRILELQEYLEALCTGEDTYSQLATAAEAAFKTLNVAGRSDMEKRLHDLKTELDHLKTRAECELDLWTRVASQRENDLESLQRSAVLLKTISTEVLDEASYAFFFAHRNLLRTGRLFQSF